MYEYLKGQLVEKSALSVVLETNGIAYRLQIPLSTYSVLPSLGQPVRLLTHFVVREDAHSLYGFQTEEERKLFRLLISVSGIGPKLAMTVLSGLSIPELKRAIVEGELVSLTSISGIGKKTAERLIVELRERLVLEAQASTVAAPLVPAANQSLVDDSMEALMALGYRKQSARSAVEKALKDSKTSKPEKLTVENLIRTSLKYV